MFAGGTIFLLSFLLLLFCFGNSQQTVYTHSQALQMLNEAGIEVTFSGQCSDRGNPECTSLEGIHSEAIDDIITVKKASLCPIVIQGATERGHRHSNHHGNVSVLCLWNIDIRKSPEDCLTNYMYNFHKISENGWRTGGTEAGHHKSVDYGIKSHSHGNGWKIDILKRGDDCITNYIKQNFQKISFNAYLDKSTGNIYMAEDHHWDIQYGNRVRTPPSTDAIGA